MKKYFKLVALVLCIGMLFQMTTFADTPENDVIYEDSDGIEILDILGIDCDFQESETVTRGEFAEFLAKALKLDGNHLPDEDPFADVYNYDLRSGYIHALKHLGVLKGSADGMFYKNRTVTVEEAYIMTLRALNYTNQLESGASPSMLANNAGLTKGLSSASTTSAMSKADVKRLIYNMLVCDYPAIEAVSYDSVSYTAYEGESVLSVRWRIFITEGILNSTNISDLYTPGDISQKNYIKIGNESFLDAENYAGNMLGRNVVAYYNEDNEIIYLYSKNNEYRVISSEEEPEYNNFTIKYYDETDSYSAKISTKFTVIYNGRALEYNGQSFMPADGKITLIDNNRDGSYDVISVRDYSYTVLKNVYIDANGKMIFQDMNNVSANVVMQGDDTSIVKCYLNGAECEPADFASGMVLRVMKSADGKYAEIYGSDMSVSGVMESSYEENGKLYIVVNGTEYLATDYFETNYKNYLQYGLNCNFRLSDNGRAVYYANAVNTYQYGFIIDTKEKSKIEKDLVIKMVTSDNRKEGYGFAERVTVDGVTLRSDSSEFKAKFVSAKNPPYQLVKFAINNDGVISKVDTTFENTVQPLYSDIVDVDDCLKNYKSRTSIKFKATGMFTPYARISNATAFYVVHPDTGTSRAKEGISENYFEAVSMSYFSNDMNYTVDLYDIDENGFANAVIVYADATVPPMSVSSRYALVDSIEDVLDEDGVKTKKLYYWNGGSFYTALFAADKVSVANGINPGDFIRMSTDTKGNITNVSFDYKFEENSFDPLYSAPDAIAGTVVLKPYRITSSSIIADVEGEMQIVPIDSAKFVIFDSKSKSIRPGTIDDAADILHVGESDATRMLIMRVYSVATVCIIYR
ncbi:MAG: S-layer homology domain-containing protein [Clostridia bacterium]|nr:S-layer homology domain-containing protein [Clostridia bacterium]